MFSTFLNRDFFFPSQFLYQRLRTSSTHFLNAFDHVLLTKSTCPLLAFYLGSSSMPFPGANLGVSIGTRFSIFFVFFRKSGSKIDSKPKKRALIKILSRKTDLIQPAAPFFDLRNAIFDPKMIIFNKKSTQIGFSTASFFFFALFHPWQHFFNIFQKIFFH